MSRRNVLYARSVLSAAPRTQIELEERNLRLVGPQSTLCLCLDGAMFTIRDARLGNRFVRELRLETTAATAVIVTPPEEGSIAPSVVKLPRITESVFVVEDNEWHSLAGWFQGGGRMRGHTIADLAKLSCIASVQFAMIIGEACTAVAYQSIWEHISPLRGGNTLVDVLRPLQDIARRHPRAADAWVAALAISCVWPLVE